MNLMDFYTAVGANYDDVMRRLITEERVTKFLSKILQDKSFENLENAMKVENFGEAFRAAHSIKGISMNLGLDRLQASSSVLTENLRSGQPDDSTTPLFEQMKQDYQDTITAIEALLESKT